MWLAHRAPRGPQQSGGLGWGLVAIRYRDRRCQWAQTEAPTGSFQIRGSLNMTRSDPWSRGVSGVPSGGAASLAVVLPGAVSRSRLCRLGPSCPLPAVLETLATCLPAHQVQDTGGNPSTFQRADWRVKERSVPQTCHSPGRPGCRHASGFPERRRPGDSGDPGPHTWRGVAHSCGLVMAPWPLRPTGTLSPLPREACTAPVWCLSLLTRGSLRFLQEPWPSSSPLCPRAGTLPGRWQALSSTRPMREPALHSFKAAVPAGCHCESSHSSLAAVARLHTDTLPSTLPTGQAGCRSHPQFSPGGGTRPQSLCEHDNPDSDSWISC